MDSARAPEEQWRTDPRYKSESGQDRFVDKHFAFRHGGVYLDIGCNDGISGSNTFFLQQVRGWQGLCVEADPTTFEMITPLSGRGDGVNFAVSGDKEADSLVFMQQKKEAGSQLNHVAAKGDDAGQSHGFHKVRVPVTTPDLLLRTHYRPFGSTINYVSIDIEGGEMAVLRSWPWKEWCVDLFGIEVLGPAGNVTSAVKTLLSREGYTHVFSAKPDAFFARLTACPAIATNMRAHPFLNARTMHMMRGCNRSQYNAVPSRSGTGAGRCAPKNSAAAVRCCAGSAHHAGCYSVCNREQRPHTRSRFELPPLAVANGLASNWDDALSECTKHSMRLCTAMELSSGLCCKTGCGMDSTWVWASGAHSCDRGSPARIPPSSAPSRSSSAEPPIARRLRPGGSGV